MRSTRLPALAFLAAVLFGACSSGASASATASAAATGTALPSAVVACPENPTLADILALDADPGPLSVAYRPDYGTYAESAAACYDNAELRFTAYVASPEGPRWPRGVRHRAGVARQSRQLDRRRRLTRAGGLLLRAVPSGRHPTRRGAGVSRSERTVGGDQRSFLGRHRCGLSGDRDAAAGWTVRRRGERQSAGRALR